MDIQLIGKTMKGKNKIREHGQFAKVVQEADKVFFSDEIAKWIFIKPHNRWLIDGDDADFIVKHI